ncbi:MAG TPA: nuclear transport factor 2 family protein [Acidimicrobiales bacterium]|nr:nuclear transport factor 2 family protein [Acidimicrobiales bacterium]
MDAEHENATGLARRLDDLSQRVGILEDTLAVQQLQHAYGYYLDKCLYDEVVDLFADDSRVIFIGGVYRGRAGAARLYAGRFRERFAEGKNGPSFGRLLDHPMLQPVVHVEPDRSVAHGRFRTLMQAGTHHSVGEPRQWWEGGIYENTYVRDGGVWKIGILNYRAFWHGTFEKGWAFTPPEYVPNSSVTYPEDPFGPDELLEGAPQLWPDTTVVPFHYPHPVTGAPPGGIR